MQFARQTFAAPSRLAAYLQNPALVTAGYACFAIDALMLWPAFATLARVVAARAPVLAFWGGTLVIMSLIARLWRAGVDHTAFQLAESQGLDRSTEFVQTNYAGRRQCHRPFTRLLWRGLADQHGQSTESDCFRAVQVRHRG